MKTIQKVGFQGDLMIRLATEVPAGFNEMESQDGQHVVAHSETGHHHTVDACGLKLFEGSDPMVAYLRLETVDHVDFIHHRPFDTHEPVRALGKPGDVFEIRRQREYVPGGWRRVED